ncbi:MAG: 4-hydroxybenzoate octaprenyltransferase [Sphingomonadales bacterium]|nr:4-hydroxybenzoate octaprenyltransferase [Sphingomonadales bacterium]
MKKQIRHYLQLIAFSHTIFAMPFALVGFSLGVREQFSKDGLSLTAKAFTLDGLWRLVLVVACMVFARSAAMAFNRFLDHGFDARNPRTATREIPAGKISPTGALVFTILNALLFVGCTFFINRLCFYLSPLALLVILGYSYTKRFTSLCHLVLGVGLALAPLGAYLAVTGHFASLPILFSLLVLCWVAGFDIIYSLQDEAFDRSQHLFSIPVWLGSVNALRLARFLHALCALLVCCAGWWGGFSFLYWAGALLFIAMLWYQHSLVKPNDLRRVNIAFMTANGIASVCFALFLIADLLNLF